MRTLSQLITIYVTTATLTACSVKPATFMLGDGQLADAAQLIDALQLADASGSSDAQSSDAAPPPEFLSCAGLPTTCSASANDNCCNSPEIPGARTSVATTW